MPAISNLLKIRNLYIIIVIVSAVFALTPALSFGQLTSDDIADLQKQAVDEGWTFEITQNPATRYSLKQLTGLIVPDNWQEMAPFDPCLPTKALPAAFDWRDVTTLPVVKNQAGCGSCWAFATVGPLECNVKIKDGVIEDFSEQWLVSCNRDGWDCIGGWFAHDYHEWKNDACGGHGTVAESEFPYVSNDAICACPYNHDYTIDGWAYIGTSYEIPSVASMKQAVYDYGPISVALHSNSALQAYGGGIFNGCDPTGIIDHAVTLVGWDDNQGDGGVWIIRNSWGTWWGEDGGYARMEYGCSRLGYAACYIDYPGLRGLNFDYPNSFPEQLTPDQTTTFEVVVTGLNESVPVSGSGQLHYIINGGSLVTVSMTETSTNHYDAVLPALACGDIIEFYVSAEEQLTGRQYDPDPTEPEKSIAALSEIIILQDNFEVDIGWFVTGNAADGHWERGVPVGGGDRGDPPTDFDSSGNCYLTDNVDGNSDIDDGTTILLSPVFDMSFGEGKISFARWYCNDAGGAANEDVMKTYISNNGGGNWTLVDSVGPVDFASGGWYENDFWPAEYITLTNNMMINFTASDIGDGSVVEAGIDKVIIKSYSCTTPPPSIITTSVPNWTTGLAYSRQLIAQGGVGQLTWSDKNGDLAGTGLTLSGQGLLSGIPNSAIPITFTAMVVDEAISSDEKTYDFTINVPPMISTTSLSDWTENQYFQQSLTCDGGTSPLGWTDKNNDLTGSGLTLSADGQLSGTPTTTGLISFTALVSDVAGANDERLLEFTINSPVSIITIQPPDWTVDFAYSFGFSQTGGTPPLVWTDKNNDLTGTGLTLSSDGLLSGTPGTAGVISFIAQLIDAAGSSDEYQFDFQINPRLQITTTSLPDWTVGVPYSQTILSTGGTGPIIFGDKFGILDGSGLSLSTSGLLSGTPSSDVVIDITVTAGDAAGDFTEQIYNFTINPALSIITTSLPDGTTGELYSFQLTCEGGTSTIVWSDKNDDLSGSGLTLSSEGLLNGTPLESGTISLTSLATDIVGGNDERPFSFNIISNFICGDVNSDLSVNIFDITFLISFLYKDGPPPDQLASADVNNDSAVNIFDATYLIAFLYGGGPDPTCP